MAFSKDDCDVFIYGTEIQEGKGTRFQSVAPRIMCIQHWSVVLVYPDGNVAVCEGNPDSKTGVLTGMLSWRTLRDLDATRSNKVRFLLLLELGFWVVCLDKSVASPDPFQNDSGSTYSSESSAIGSIPWRP